MTALAHTCSCHCVGREDCKPCCAERAVIEAAKALHRVRMLYRATSPQMERVSEEFDEAVEALLAAEGE